MPAWALCAEPPLPPPLRVWIASLPPIEIVGSQSASSSGFAAGTPSGHTESS